MEFTVYNANVNLFCIVTLTLENSALGEPSLLEILTLACVSNIAESCCLGDWGPGKLGWGSEFSLQLVLP